MTIETVNEEQQDEAIIQAIDQKIIDEKLKEFETRAHAAGRTVNKEKFQALVQKAKDLLDGQGGLRTLKKEELQRLGIDERTHLLESDTRKVFDQVLNPDVLFDRVTENKQLDGEQLQRFVGDVRMVANDVKNAKRRELAARIVYMEGIHAKGGVRAVQDFLVRDGEFRGKVNELCGGSFTRARGDFNRLKEQGRHLPPSLTESDRQSFQDAGDQLMLYFNDVNEAMRLMGSTKIPDTLNVTHFPAVLEKPQKQEEESQREAA